MSKQQHDLTLMTSAGTQALSWRPNEQLTKQNLFLTLTYKRKYKYGAKECRREEFQIKIAFYSCPAGILLQV